MKILITGGSGFVGRNIKEYFEKRNYNVYAPTSTQLNCLNEEAVKEHLQNNYYDFIFHFASYGDSIDHSKDGTKILEYNLRIFLNFARYSSFYGKMIYTGSGAEYDKRYPIEMVAEEDLKKHSIPTDQYGLMKYTVNSIIENSTNIYNLRLFGIFGKYEHWQSKYISNLCCKSIKGLPLTMRKNCYFDYIWIDDFADMLEKFIQIDRPLFHTYNAVSGQRIDLFTLADIVKQISGKKQEIIACKDGFANEYTASNQRILKEIPEITYTNIKVAIQELYSWYKSKEDEIDLYSLIYG